MSEWREVTLSDVSGSVDYGYTASSSLDPVGPRFLRITDIVSANLDWAEVPYCEIDDKAFERFRLEEGDIVVARTGATVGHGRWVSPSEPSVFASYLVRFRPSDDVNARFVGYIVESPTYKEFVKRSAGGAAQPNANAKVLGSFSFPLPSRATQDRVVALLQPIDDLVENNRRRIALLEHMAQAIYREWFVHFRYPGHEDDELVDSPLGPIPAGWRVMPLFDEADVGFGFALKSKGFGSSGDWRVIRIRDVPNGYTPTRTDEFPGERYIVDEGDTLIGMDGDFHMCRWPGGRALLNQRVTRVRPRGLLGPEALYWSLRGPIKAWNEQIVGTTVAHLGKRHLEVIALVVPPADKARALNGTLDPLGELSLGLRSSIARLGRLRDLVLPKLVTGAIDVSHLDLDSLLDDVAA